MRKFKLYALFTFLVTIVALLIILGLAIAFENGILSLVIIYFLVKWIAEFANHIEKQASSA